MVYPLVEDVLNRGAGAPDGTRRVLRWSLAPRLQRAFPDNAVVALYGGSEQRWELGDITISTTHQLLRLERCFDLVVLDELDAFPYHNNPMSPSPPRRACKRRGKTVLLTATPPREQQLRMRQGQRRLPHAMVPVRYHRHPLPVPRIMRYRGLAHLLGTGHLPSKLRAALDESLQRGAQIFVFVPRIEHVLPLTRLLRKAYASAVDATAVDGTSSRDAERAEKVRRFRSCDIPSWSRRRSSSAGSPSRGATSISSMRMPPCSMKRRWSRMAGRAGRSADDPCGRVIYCARERTDGTVSAVRQIRAMNRLARQRGLLLDNQVESRRRKKGGK